MSVLFHRSLFVIAALAALSPLTAAGQDAPRRPGSGMPSAQAQTSAPDEASASWEVQFAGHGGLAGLVSGGEVRLAIASSVSPVEETVGYSRERSWGAGLRVMRGRWGVEVQHHRVAERTFTPAAMMREISLFGSQDLPLTESADDLLSAFAVWEMPLANGQARFYLAAGGGYLLMGGDSGRLALEDLPPGISRSTVLGDASGGASLRMTEGDFRADRGVVVAGGSLGLTLKMGRMFLRPRLDAFLGGARTTEESWGMHFDLPGVRDQTASTMTLDTTMRPRLFLFSVEVGWSSRP